jgi:hypothetical protein
MAAIFISYRRDDTEGFAGRLFDRIKDHFGDDSVFLDVEERRPLGILLKRSKRKQVPAR